VFIADKLLIGILAASPTAVSVKVQTTVQIETADGKQQTAELQFDSRDLTPGGSKQILQLGLQPVGNVATGQSATGLNTATVSIQTCDDANPRLLCTPKLNIEQGASQIFILDNR
jgi:hypothetical protein